MEIIILRDQAELATEIIQRVGAIAEVGLGGAKLHQVQQRAVLRPFEALQLRTTDTKQVSQCILIVNSRCINMRSVKCARVSFHYVHA